MSSPHDSKDAEPAPDPPTTPEPHLTSLSIIILEIVWNIFDTLVLIRLGTIYLHRFEDFAHCTHNDAEADQEITEWRNAQQAEWNTLATSVSQSTQKSRDFITR